MSREPDHFEPLPLTLIRQILIEGPLTVPNREPDPYQSGSGVFTQESLHRVFDELRNGPPLAEYELGPACQASGEPFRNVFRRPNAWLYQDWTVEADGWRLVIEGGAMLGLVRTAPEIVVSPIAGTDGLRRLRDQML